MLQVLQGCRKVKINKIIVDVLVQDIHGDRSEMGLERTGDGLGEEEEQDRQHHICVNTGTA